MGDHVEHYGTPRHSGRYPWGSGKNPQRSKNWIQRDDEYKKQGLTEKERANAWNLSTTDYRARRSIYGSEVQMADIRKCVKLRDTGMSIDAISKETGLPPSTVRSYLDPTKTYRANKVTTVANALKEAVEKKPYLDVGEGVDRQLNISEEQLKIALAALEQQGYSVQTLRIQQPTNPNNTTVFKVLTKDGVTRKEIFDNREQISSPDGLYFEDYGEVLSKNNPVQYLDSKRVAVRYAENGGGEKDGVIELRPGVEDISLGARSYAQVRIGVDGTHYLKGMAVYSNDLPDGVDILFNTSKHEGTPMMGDKKNTVLKPVERNEDGSVNEINPFGANFRNPEYTGSDGQSHIPYVNVVNDDTDWDKWKKSLSSQWLSKQSPQLAKRQLELDYQGRENEFNSIMDIPNPTVRRQLLDKFADECDSAAVHLKGAALPRQGTFAILPVMSLKDTEVYAPGYDDGEEVVLVRFPHAGTFEMPRLRVNNSNPEGKEVLGPHPAHAIGINANVAKQLSGADYDGDTVLVIPTKGQKIKSDTTDPDSPLHKLRDFDPKESYRKSPDDIPTGKGDGFNKQRQMGDVSNLINDMTIMGATADEIARADRHSMVIIDAEKHNLDWRASAIDNNIAELKEKYQGRANAGAATLISRRKQTADDTPERKELTYTPKPDDELYEDWISGKKIYQPTGRTYVDKKGNVVTATYKNREGPYKILENDAHSMSSGYLVEEIYADYAENCKALGDRARSELRKTGMLKMNPEAKAKYADEVRSLNDKLNVSALNAPLERQATAIASKKIAMMCDADPTLRDKEHKDRLRKAKAKAMENARVTVGAGRKKIDITEREWEAIQAGAISDTRLTQILRYADIGAVRQLATPRERRGMSASAKSLARQLLRAGYPQAVVAERVGVSTTTLAKEFDNFNDLGGAVNA